jgi:hypothetical protein
MIQLAAYSVDHSAADRAASWEKIVVRHVEISSNDSWLRGA